MAQGIDRPSIDMLFFHCFCSGFSFQESNKIVLIVKPENVALPDGAVSEGAKFSIQPYTEENANSVYQELETEIAEAKKSVIGATEDNKVLVVQKPSNQEEVA